VPLATYTIQGYYSGDATHAASVSPAMTVEIVKPATTSTTLTATPLTVTQGQQVTLSSAVTSNAGTPTGTVTFLYGSYVIGSAALSHGTASLTASTTGVPVGSYGLHASYSGSVSFLVSSSPIVTVTVN
jgi:hypothetical protein